VEVSDIVKNSFLAGLEPEDAFDFIDEIKSILIREDKNALASYIRFPISDCNKYQGKTIESEEQFIEQYNDIVDGFKEDFLSWDTMNANISWKGIRGPGITFVSICDDASCNPSYTIISEIKDYCYFKVSPLVVSYDTDELKSIEENFSFGTYVSISYEVVGGSLINPKDFLGDRIEIELDTFTHKFGGVPCESPEYEFTPPVFEFGSALWGNIPTVGDIRVSCDGQFRYLLHIINDFLIGNYTDGYIFIFKLEIEDE
jgi:hypothetical protein